MSTDSCTHEGRAAHGSVPQLTACVLTAALIDSHDGEESPAAAAAASGGAGLLSALRSALSVGTVQPSQSSLQAFPAATRQVRQADTGLL